MSTGLQAAVDRYARHLGYALDDERIEAFAAALREHEAAFDEVAELVDLPTPPERDYWDPDPATDPNGAFLTRCAVGGGDGPLSGTTVAVKDNIAVAGVPMTVGSPAMAGFVPRTDATVVERLLDAGARVVGKANLDEFAHGRHVDSMPFRRAKNPHDPVYQPGSSSTGSGVAVADGLADVALGTDNGGSVRYPAAWCGVVGLKPTRGLVSHHGFVRGSKTCDTVGVLARETDGVARGLQAIAGEDPRDDMTSGAVVGDYVAAVERGRSADPTDLVVGVPEQFVGHAPALDDVAGATLDRLADAGAELRSISVDAVEHAPTAYRVLTWAEFGNYVRASATDHGRVGLPDPELASTLHERLSADTGAFPDRVVLAALSAEHLSREYGDRPYALAHHLRKRVTDGLDAALAEVDVLASTTLTAPPPRHDEPIPAAGGNTMPANVGGHPAVSVPCGEHDGFPVGLQFLGGWFEEATVLRAAASVETVLA
ncbi:amidase [Halorarius litoreus]|uniref:amidase n=1 Tax=Halorarius litoreus TaxID=2962676 RepID=UPI0020CC3B1E|nr:amidase family protein [Halorarius litoreus]